MSYRTSNQIHEEQEELAIAELFDETKDVQNLTHLLRGGEMKEFYKVANKILKIKRSNPVVNKVQRENMNGDIEVITEKVEVDNAIAEYFTDIYKRPSHMQLRPDQIDFDID